MAAGLRQLVSLDGELPLIAGILPADNPRVQRGSLVFSGDLSISAAGRNRPAGWWHCDGCC